MMEYSDIDIGHANIQFSLMVLNSMVAGKIECNEHRNIPNVVSYNKLLPILCTYVLTDFIVDV